MRPSHSVSNAQGNLYSGGLALFIGGYVLDVVGLLIDPDGNGNKADPGYFMMVIEAIMQVTGLIMLTQADLDANNYFKHHRARLKLFTFCWALYYILFSLGSMTEGGLGVGFMLEAFPLGYLFYRFTPIVEMEKGYKRTTEILTIVLALDLVGNGLVYFIGCIYFDLKMWPGTTITIISVCNAAAVMYAHRWSKRQGDSLTICFNTAVFTYLFCWGVQVFIWYFVALAIHSPVATSISFLIVGPIHFIPTSIMLFFRKPIQGRLGREWLRKRVQNVDTHFTAAEASRGNLAEVEQAICKGRDLNARLRVENNNGDEYTLLCYAAGNGHTDALRRLLTETSVAVNFVSKNGAAPIHLAVQNGHVECLQIMIDAKANVDQSDAHGSSPLYVAALHGHAECVRLLVSSDAIMDMQSDILVVASAMDHSEVISVLMELNAVEDDRSSSGYGRKPSAWMGVAPADVALELRQTSVLQILKAYESQFIGNVLPAHGIHCVVSWPGIYSRLWDRLVARAKDSELSAAVVFLPERTANYGKHSSDKCYCDELYGEVRGMTVLALSNLQYGVFTQVSYSCSFNIVSTEEALGL
jgi:hypothetical protein